jgi:hypothetical protein
MGKPISGTWMQHEGMLSFQLDGGQCTYSGNWAGGKAAIGVIAAFDNERQYGDFYMLSDKHEYHVTKKSELSKSDIHRDGSGHKIEFRSSKPMIS